MGGDKPRRRDETEDAAQPEKRGREAPGSFTGDDPEPAHELPRTATDMAPGIPAGSGEGIDEALRQPDTELGGGVAGDTTVGSETKEKPDLKVIRTEDKERNTM